MQDKTWQRMLCKTEETNVNYEHLSSLQELSSSMVAAYVNRTLAILDTFENENLEIIESIRQTLQWSEVAKCGSPKERGEWEQKGYNLHMHNLGSAEIYKENATGFNPVVYVLIKTHGMLGQYNMGEVNFDTNRELYDLVSSQQICPEDLKRILKILNYCVLNGVKEGLYESIRDKLEWDIDRIVKDEFEPEKFYDKDYILQRLKILRQNSYGDDYSKVSRLLDKDEVRHIIGSIFKKSQLWYFNAALSDFTTLETVKIFLLINAKMDSSENYPHISFDKFMKNMYRDYQGIKVIDLFKKRIMESYLKNLDIEELLQKQVTFNKHVSGNLIIAKDAAEFQMTFSPQAQKLIEFCEVAYGEDEIYNRAIMILYDLFGFRRDNYDRFYNEDEYLKNMDSSLTHKAKLLDYIKGNKVLDVGPGGGSLMDLIEDRMPGVEVYGIDISQNVIENLAKKKAENDKKWNVVQGDALSLENHFEFGQIDTVIYSSIIHELYSYIPTNGQKFNRETICKAIESAYSILPNNGRIIIRDGIMTEPIGDERIIEFKNASDMEFLDNYCRDFQGRKITYEKLGNNKAKMKVNDVMEFLYTYTWGKDSYAHEIQEQFGYFTPTEYLGFFKENFKGKLKVVEFKHFLQEGYEENLMNKINFYDEQGNPARLPDSTCILVAEVEGSNRRV